MRPRGRAPGKQRPFLIRHAQCGVSEVTGCWRGGALLPQNPERPRQECLPCLRDRLGRFYTPSSKPEEPDWACLPCARTQVHHFCTLIGYGADGICPYLAFETLAALREEGKLAATESDDALATKYIKVSKRG